MSSRLTFLPSLPMLFKWILLTIVLITGNLLVLTAEAQSHEQGRLSGQVLDSASAKAVEFASVALLNSQTDQPVNGAVCDSNGNFELSNVTYGTYALKVTFVGYNTKTIAVVVNQRDAALGKIRLASTTKILSEVVVEGQKALVEDKIDRIVYNAEADKTTTGGDASDVLKRVPLLAVDPDGNVSLRGSNNVLVLINGKPSTITAGSVADALKQIPADMIRNVEVITSPSAKYDAEGSAGIINIILKKNTLQGIFFNAEGTTSNRGTSLTSSLNYRTKKSGFSLGLTERSTYNLISGFSNHQTTRVGRDTTLNYQTAANRGRGKFGQVIAGWDFEPDKKNKFSATVRLGTSRQYNNQNNLLTESFHADQLIGSTLRQVTTTNFSNSFDGSIGYTRTFEKKDRELSFLGIYSRSNPDIGFVTNTYDSATHSMIVNSYKNTNRGYTQDMIAQVDLKEPLAENQFLEYGVKSLSRDVSSQYQYFFSKNSDQDYQVLADQGLSNSFQYNQRISAGYLSYTFHSGGWNFRAGARYEYTSIKSYFATLPKFDIPSYGVLVPSVNLSRKLANGNLLKVSFNKRIQRPAFRDLNPNLQASNFLNATQGNPNLKPEYTYLYEIAYSTTVKSASINLSLFARNNRNDIQPARIIRHDTIIAVSQNIGSEDNYGFSAFMTIPVLRSFSISAGVDLFYRILKNNSADTTLNASNKGLTKNFRFSGNYKIGKGWTVQFFSFFQGRQYNLQGYRTGLINHSISVNKEFMGKKMNLGLGADNFLTPSFNVYSQLHSPYLDQYTATTLHNRIVKVNLNYKIGKLKVTERKTGLGNED
jgi:outer membrane receptor protein involved in Fe transport